MSDPGETSIAFAGVPVSRRTSATQLGCLLESGMHIIVMQNQKFEVSIARLNYAA